VEGQADTFLADWAAPLEGAALSAPVGGWLVAGGNFVGATGGRVCKKHRSGRPRSSLSCQLTGGRGRAADRRPERRWLAASRAFPCQRQPECYRRDICRRSRMVRPLKSEAVEPVEHFLHVFLSFRGTLADRNGISCA